VTTSNRFEGVAGGVGDGFVAGGGVCGAPPPQAITAPIQMSAIAVLIINPEGRRIMKD
jgi:hypothetical protein